MKRAFDIVGSLIGILLLWPVGLLVALLIKLDSKGSWLFTQERVGRGFVPFKIYKFRTMVEVASPTGPLITASGDTRVTRVGRFLRRTKLDELPQLLNVLRGDMSFVGARPEVRRYVDLFRDDFAQILQRRPGITDAASILYREESQLLKKAEDPEGTYTRVILPEKLRLSRGYGEQASLGFDLRLISSTIVCLLYPARLLEQLFDAAGRVHLALAVLVQAALLTLASWCAAQLRFEGTVPPHELALFLRMLPVFVGLQLLWLQPFDLFRGVWRYTGVREVRNIAVAVTAGSLCSWLVMRFAFGVTSYSRAVIILQWLLAITLLAGVRLVRRLHREIQSGGLPTHKIVIVGHEDPMERIVREIVDYRVYDCRVVGLVNGNPDKKGMSIHGIPILGTRVDIAAILQETRPDEVLIALPADEAEERAALLKECRRHCASVRVVPDVTDVLGRNEPRNVHEEDIDPEDLLFREPIESRSAPVQAALRGRRVMITGAGGSVGSEISRQVASCEPDVLILFERHEFSLYEIDRELRGKYPELAITPVIGDVADAERVAEITNELRPQMIFHAAAYKHVPMLEHNPAEALRTNVAGTATVALAAGNCGAEVFVLISTDKAVEPLSIMGTTKRISELVVQDLHGTCPTRFLTVRFGNVLESSGSVVPLFKEQIQQGGPVTVTHPDVARLFMTVTEATQLILLAATVGTGGEVFVLQMGRPIRILDMAQELIRRYAPAHGRKIEIVFTGLRPGERLFEKLFNDHETVWKTEESKLLMAISSWDAATRREELERLLEAVEARVGQRATRVRRVLTSVPTEHREQVVG